jgi:hypothetical protein
MDVYLVFRQNSYTGDIEGDDGGYFVGAYKTSKKAAEVIKAKVKEEFGMKRFSAPESVEYDLDGEDPFYSDNDSEFWIYAKKASVE